MGNRATYYLRRQGELQISSSHWGATGLDAALLGGPDSVRHHFDPPDPSYAYADEIMCEAGYLLDADLKRLHFFGGDLVGNVLPVRAAYLGLLALAWPGWQVAYAENGIRTLGELLGGPGSEVVVESDLALVKPLPLDFLAEALPLIPALGEGEDAAVITLVSGGSVIDHLFPTYDPVGLLGLGTFLLAHLSERFRSELPSEADNLLVRGGAILEPEVRTLTVWLASPRLLDFQFIARRWPGWTLVRQHEGLPRHAERTGRDPANHRLPTEEAVARLLRELDEGRTFRRLPAVREVLRGVPEDDAAEAARLAEHLSTQAG